ncbi:Zn(II)2Cys6 transcription factor [Aspergillus affinis]|uniref:Zn(II)2Cys6 transcription factor n=1 Tax=Aspergillus affinis TaxID=1070780 RepID=UPI0022FE60FC|nr:uncharacterized protein KD926_007866 [Aspergillus affinis]KAI9040650.1 hypothetical protein KD926_007866 [Aspergillus affinis]
MPKIQKTVSDHARNRRIDARSCLGCHRRKVRCDRGVPCTNCARAGCTCVYPSSEQKSPSLQGIADRLERVESILAYLCENRGPGVATSGDSEDQGRQDAISHRPSPAQRSHMSWELLLNDGQMVQYVNNSNIKDLLQDDQRMKMTPASGPEREPSQLQQASTPRLAAQPRPPTSTSSGLLEFYPDSQLALRLWSVYVKSVDPVLKILHIPTTQSAVIATILDPKSAGSSMVALTFAIYFAAITALGFHGEPELSVEERSVLLKRYKTALDRLLIATDVMNQPEMTALQALAIFTTCLRVHETGRSSWVLNGLAIRLAQSLGLHRDGADLQLSPFDTEMRLRLWWHLCVLDSRAPEDQGFELTLDAPNRNLRLPLNIDDHQLFPTMTQLPPETTGWTEMSFFLIQTESCQLINPILGTREPFSADALPDITAKRKLIHDRSQLVARKHGISFPPRPRHKASPAAAAAAAGGEPRQDTLARVAMQHFITARRKMEFMLTLREEISMQMQNGNGPGNPKPHPTDTSNTDGFRPSFRLACESMESNSLLKSSFSDGFRWLFTTYTPWYALAYVLRCLCSCPSGTDTERAWKLIDAVFPVTMSLDGEGVSSDSASNGAYSGQGQTQQAQGQGSIWKCLTLLRAQALSLRRARSRSQSRPSSNEIDGDGEGDGDHEIRHMYQQGHVQLQPLVVENSSYVGHAHTNVPEAVVSSSPHQLPHLLPHPHSHSHPPELTSFQEEHTFLTDNPSSNPNIFSGVDFSMSEIPFLPEWNAVMNGFSVGEGDTELW